MKAKSKLLIILGATLILAGIGIMAYGRINAYKVNKQSEGLVSAVENVMPPKSDGGKGTYSSMNMPALEVQGRDVIALICFFEQGVTLPVAQSFDESMELSIPQRVEGTVYDGSLVVAGADIKGQLECLKSLELGDKVTLSDMTGAEFDYEVTSIVRKKSTTDIKNDEKTDLVIYTKDSSFADYIVVSLSENH